MTQNENGGGNQKKSDQEQTRKDHTLHDSDHKRSFRPNVQADVEASPPPGSAPALPNKPEKK